MQAMQNKNDFNYTGAVVLGMHDAIVSLTGLIAGLAFAIPSRTTIVLTAIISSVVAALSMGAANYLALHTQNHAHRHRGRDNSFTAALYTGITYMLTCALLVLPIMFIRARLYALLTTFAVAVAIIFVFNLVICKIQHRSFLHGFSEMLAICGSVSIVAYLIGLAATYFLGIGI